MPRFFIALIVFIAFGILVLAGTFMTTGPTRDQPKSPHDTSAQQQREPDR